MSRPFSRELKPLDHPPNEHNMTMRNCKARHNPKGDIWSPGLNEHQAERRDTGDESEVEHGSSGVMEFKPGCSWLPALANRMGKHVKYQMGNKVCSSSDIITSREDSQLQVGSFW